MKFLKKFCYKFLVLSTLLPCLSLAQSNEKPVSKDFSLIKEGNEYILSYEGTHNIQQSNDSLTRCVFSFHGANRNPDVYFNSMYSALKIHVNENQDEELLKKTMILAPHMLSQECLEQNPSRYNKGYYPYWGSGWREGSNSKSIPTISNFDLIENMLLTIQENFPNIKTFVLVGHSAGGQLLSRYVLSNTVHDKLIASGCKIRYVIANSSSFVYLDKYRPNLEEDSGFIEIIQNPCEKNNFNDWKYGLENIDLYPSKTPVKEMISNLKNRDVVFLQGSEDVNTDHSSLDKRCEGMLQGKNRLERGLRYFEYLGFYYGKEIYLNKHLDLINGISHSNNDIFQSSIGRHWIFNF